MIFDKLSIFVAFGGEKLWKYAKYIENKLGLSCAKLSKAWASYPLAIGYVAYTKAAYYII